ncbi:GUN4 domain-containing protein [Rivularia sp. UHCC 0363]|uniref:GUN4 domain-containing protein n=1 Tax=Rivularia sp. UHCC 0363 TaxID=3110244 RepID=UPI002B204E74|nr:GUN4 domain-containing protein [Rivularia sp. UHCC 0363]MEA5593119.1 GUN4 domain-containing protein [Rivularia sp. UHCC 0363]
MVDQYIFSGSLPENASTYVTRDADRDLYDGLRSGKFCYVLNSRQSGKSSLRVRTMRRLRENGVECAAIDLSAGGIQNVPPEQWYADLIDSLIDIFDLDVDFGEWWGANQLNSLVTKFRKFLEEILLVEVKENIVIFIDEIDSVLSLDFPTDDFFAFIRSCYNQRVDNPAYNRLTFCLLGVASPSNLIQDKQRTPFNIGKAISLKGFQLHEVEPLEKGFRGKFSDSQAVMQEILDWTKGQPFLTQKLCQFMVEESDNKNPRTVEEVVKSKIIESWESQDEPEHLRTIRARILRNEERAGYLLDLYQQVRSSEEQSEIIDPPLPPLERGVYDSSLPLSVKGVYDSSLPPSVKGVYDSSLPPFIRGVGGISNSASSQTIDITADNTLEQSELLLSGLVARREGKLRVYNLIYQQVFNENWVENELNNLRPYSESFKFWVASGGKDESRLLRGKALVDAEEWGKDKNLSYQDKQFLAASREKEIQEKIAVDERDAQLERERKDKEAVEKRNLVLSEANRKAKQRIRNGTIVLSLALLGTVTSITIAGWKVLEAQKKLEETYTYVANPLQLKELVGKLSPDSEEAIDISKKADVKVKDHLLEQVYLHTSKSLTYQYLNDWKSAEQSIKHSMNFLTGWKENKGKIADNKSNSEFLQLRIFALTVRGNVLKQKKDTQNAKAAYQEAFDILKNRKINPFKPELSIVDKNTIESLYRGLIELLLAGNITENDQLDEVRNSFKRHLYDALEYSLKNQSWREADQLTNKLMLFIANRTERDYLLNEDIETFSCSDLKKIDNYWVQNSDGRFGFSVQKQIWIEAGLKNYESFASRVGWYDSSGKTGYLSINQVIEIVEKNYQEAPVGILPRGLNIPNLSQLRFYSTPNERLLFSRAATCKV